MTGMTADRESAPRAKPVQWRRENLCRDGRMAHDFRRCLAGQRLGTIGRSGGTCRLSGGLYRMAGTVPAEQPHFLISEGM
jgi:hypothetical protein